MTVRSLYVCDVLHRRFHHLCGMLTPKRSRTGTGPTTLRLGTRHLPFLSGTVIRLCWVTVEAFQADLALAEQMMIWMLGGNGRLKESNAALASCRGVCAHYARIAMTVASPWPRLCEALVTAFASNTKARLDQKCSDCDVNNSTVLQTINYCWR